MISSLELARLCGVSQGTVDRALHGRSGVAEATRARILATAAEHGYRANPAARELMGRAASSLVGAVVDQGWQQASFFIELLGALHRRLRRDGLRLVIAFADDDADQLAAIDELAARRVRGLLLIHPPGSLALPAHLGIPVVSLVQAHAGVPSPLPDERAMGAAAARHLLDLGHRRLAWLGYPDANPVTTDRREGFRAAAAQGGATVLATTGIDAALASDATAIACHHDPLARQLLGICANRGVRVPEDRSIVGIDGTGPDDGLSTVVYPIAAVADAAAVLLAGGAAVPIAAGTVRQGRTTVRA